MFNNPETLVKISITDPETAATVAVEFKLYDAIDGDTRMHELARSAQLAALEFNNA